MIVAVDLITKTTLHALSGAVKDLHYVTVDEISRKFGASQK